MKNNYMQNKLDEYEFKIQSFENNLEEMYNYKDGYKNPRDKSKNLNHLMLLELQDRIKFGEDNIKYENQLSNIGDTVVILGSTGIGKTACANIFSHGEAEVKLERGAMVYSYGKSQIPSDTTLPRKFIDQTNKISYWDTPGFFDTKGLVQDVSNYYYIKKLFSLCGSLKFIYVINKNDLDRSNSDTLDAKIEGIQSFLSTIQDNRAEKYITLVINKASNKASIENFLPTFKEDIQELSKKNKIKDSSKKFLEYYANNPNQIVFVPVARDDDEGRIVDLKHVSKKVADTIKLIAPLGKEFFPSAPRFITDDKNKDMLNNIYQWNIDNLISKVKHIISSVTAKFTSTLESDNYEGLVKFKTKEIVGDSKFNYEKTVKEFVKISTDFFNLNKEEVVQLNDMFYFLSYCEELIEILKLSKSTKHANKITGLLKGFVEDTQKQILDLSKEKQEALVKVIKNEFFSAITSALNTSINKPKDLTHKISNYKNLDRIYQEEMIKELDVFLSSIEKVKDITSTTQYIGNINIPQIARYAKFIDVAFNQLLHNGISDKKNFEKQLKTLFPVIEQQIKDIFTFDKNLILKMLQESTNQGFKKFFSELNQKLEESTFKDIKKTVGFFPDTLDKLNFIQIMDSVYKNYSDNEIIKSIYNLINELSDVFRDYEFIDEKNSYVKEFKDTFLMQGLEKLSFSTFITRFNFTDVSTIKIEKLQQKVNNLESEKNYLFTENNQKITRLEQDQQKLEILEGYINRLETSPYYILKKEKLTKKGNNKEDKFIEKDNGDGIASLNNKIKNLEEVFPKEIKKNDCTIFHFTVKYDNALLNRPDLLSQLKEQFGFPAVNRLIQLNLTENELVEATEYNSFADLLGCDNLDSFS